MVIGCNDSILGKTVLIQRKNCVHTMQSAKWQRQYSLKAPLQASVAILLLLCHLSLLMMFLVEAINLMHDNHFADGGEYVEDQFEDEKVEMEDF